MSALRFGDPDEATVASAYASLVSSAHQLVVHIYSVHERIGTHLDAAFLSASHIAEEIPKRLLDYLIVEYVKNSSEALFETLMTMGIFELPLIPRDETTFTSEHVRRIIRFDRLSKLLTDPSGILRDVYGWGTNAPDIPNLVFRLFRIFSSLDFPVTLVIPDRTKKVNLSAPIPVSADTEFERLEMRLPFFKDDPSGTEIGLTLVPVPARQASRGGGVAICPYATGVVNMTLPLDRDGRWILELTSDLDLRLGVGIVARPEEELRVLTDILGSGTEDTGSFSAQLRNQAESEEERITIFRDRGGSSLSAIRTYIKFGLSAGTANKPELMAELGCEGGKATISMSGADSFLARILPSTPLDINFDFGIGASTQKGMYLTGNVGLEKVVGIGRTLGPLNLQSLYFSIKPSTDGSIPVVLTINGSAHIGPLTISAEKVGFEFKLTFPESGGNLGPANIEAAFKPPAGLGLYINAAGLSGGGYLYFDNEKQEYAGVLQLKIKSIDLKAIGLLNTRLPDGRPGFSLLIIITTEFQPGFQLGFGFTLKGVGGLLGLNRTVVVDTLRNGIKNHTLDSILFPSNPIADAPRILSDLRSIFPPAEGRFVFGPVAKLGWGNPTLITAELGLILEVPDPVRLVILGKIAASLPSRDLSLIKLHMDILGVIDFERSTVAIDSSLYDSKLLTYDLSGDMALRVNGGENPNFALSLGGLNPRYQPPPGFPTLARLQVNVSNGDNPRLSLQAYLALTSNTLQFGALLELYAESGGFNISGHLGFDCLFQFSPFEFIADISASVALRRGSTTLAAVGLDGTLSGPRPWRARGRASIRLWLFRVSVGFDESWGESGAVTLPELDVWPLLEAALSDPQNWSADLPPQSARTVSYRAIDDLGPRFVVVDPFGSLTVREKIAPLNHRLTKFGNSVPSGDSFFNIVRATVGGVSLPFSKQNDFFALAQFEEMSDDQKLSRPDFERMETGINIGSEEISAGDAIEAELAYETHIIDLKGKREVLRDLFVIDVDLMLELAKASAIHMSPLWNAGEDKYTRHINEQGVHLDDELYVVANTNDMRARSDIMEENNAGRSIGMTKSEAYALLKSHLHKRPEDVDNLQVISVQEVSRAA